MCRLMRLESHFALTRRIRRKDIAPPLVWGHEPARRRGRFMTHSIVRPPRPSELPLTSESDRTEEMSLAVVVLPALALVSAFAVDTNAFIEARNRSGATTGRPARVRIATTAGPFCSSAPGGEGARPRGLRRHPAGGSLRRPARGPAHIGRGDCHTVLDSPCADTPGSAARLAAIRATAIPPTARCSSESSDVEVSVPAVVEPIGSKHSPPAKSQATAIVDRLSGNRAWGADAQMVNVCRSLEAAGPRDHLRNGSGLSRRVGPALGRQPIITGARIRRRRTHIGRVRWSSPAHR